MRADDRSDPRKLYPMHLAFLATSLAQAGDDIRAWTIMHAAETRLDEDGMEVELVLLRRGPHPDLRTWWVTVANGRLAELRSRLADPALHTPVRGSPILR